MNKEELWQYYVSKNPSFDGHKPITITPHGLRKMFNQTWEQAVQHTKHSEEKFQDLLRSLGMR